MTHTDILLEAGTNELEIIEFYMDEVTSEGVERRYFGVNVAKVLEVVEAPKGLERSEAASHPSFLGTIPLRNLILPVVDLGVWLEMRRSPAGNEPIIVTEFNAAITGFLVTGVTQIHRVCWADVEPPSRYVASMENNCITGTIKIGDRFVLMLDLEQVLADLDEQSGSDSEPLPKIDGERYRALVADDSTSVRQLLESNFSRCNFEVTMARDGAEAWSILESIKTKSQAEGGSPLDYLDVVVSDVEMPRLDGYTLTRKVKEDPVLKALPVVLFSSLISESVMHKGKAVMADAQVTKPEFHGLAEKVVDLIRGWGREEPTG